ncbi:MAG TPA: DUF1223 domain-containing protein [Edaphobacter sp.]|nr:DUF1223 domain-containing protein [Edaphobacter sp.]
MSPLRSFAVAAALFGVFTSLPTSSAAQTTQSNRTPVLVELFTSEGCSSCPPADALLAKLDQSQPINGADIIVLGEHVDYWDGQGWHDRFSSHQYTERQNEYCGRLHVDSSYTPQMIVDGTDQFVGNDAAHAVRAIQHAAQSSKIKLTISQPVVDGQKVSASVSSPDPTTTKKADLYAALVDPKDTTEVRGGENGGRRLQHAGVVRSLQRVGKVKDLGAGPISFSLNAPADSKPGEMRVVVFAQESGLGAVLGAASGGVTP